MSTTLSNAALRSSSSIVAKSSSSKNAASAALGSTRTMAGGKEIRFGVEGRAAMLRGVDLMADAVQVSDEMYYYYFKYINTEQTLHSSHTISLSCSHTYTHLSLLANGYNNNTNNR
jgi:hypothetical protein